MIFSSLRVLRPLFAAYLPQACLQNRRMTPRFSVAPCIAPAASPGTLSDRLAPCRRRPRAPQRFHHSRQLRPSLIGLRTVHDADDVEDASAAGCGAAHGASHSLEEFIATVEAAQPVRVLGTAVFMTAQPTGTLPALAHDLRHNKVLHKRSVVLTVATAQVPHVPNEERLGVQLSDAIGSTSASRQAHGEPERPRSAGANRASNVSSVTPRMSRTSSGAKPSS